MRARFKPTGGGGSGSVAAVRGTLSLEVIARGLDDEVNAR